jgi:oligopeptide/dipeptide ABC transporter ATP-binding protein
MGFSNEPSLLIADEPTTALDVTIQAQILDLLRDLQSRLGLGLLLITHDLGVVAEMGDRVAVMYAGRIVEDAAVRDLFRDPRHPYTRGLLGSIPGGASGSKLQAIRGTVPPLGHLPPGCAFAPRCPNRFEPCDAAPPGVTLIEAGGARREARPSAIGEPRNAPPASPLAHPHSARCYLYSPAVDPEVLPEAPR